MSRPGLAMGSLTEVSKNGKEFYLVRIQNNSFNDFVVVVQLLSHA